MDRLQIAIQKARAQRASVTQAPLPHGSPDDATTVPQPPAAPDLAATEEAWNRFEPLNLDAKELQKNRLIATTAGKEAAPYDLLRTRMLHQIRANGWRRIGVVSPMAASGKTTTVANLAFSFSRHPEVRVLVLDLDLRRPSLARMLGQNVRFGMEDILTGKVDFADHGRLLGKSVAIGMNNTPATAPSELLQSRGAEAAIERLEATYAPDVVLIDLSPMLVTDDNFGFLNKVDAVLIMAAAEETTTTALELTIRQIEDLTQIMGIVLNKCRYAHGAYGYGYGSKNSYY